MEFSVSPEARAVLDEAAILSTRRGKFYVGVEHIFEALVTRADLLPESFAAHHVRPLTAALGGVREAEWQGVTPITDSNEVYYTPRALDVMREATRLAQHLRRGHTVPLHLLMVIVQQDTSEVCRVLDASGINRPALVEAAQNAILKSDHAEQSVEPAAQGATTAENATKGPEQEDTVSVADFTTNLTEAARRGEISKPYGRDKEILDIVQVLLRKEKNNVILIGNAGVGKTKIVEGIAAGCASGELGDLLGDKEIIELNVAALLSGTQYRGAFESKLIALLEDLERSNDKILFIDEIHLIMGAGATDGDSADMANLLKPALGRGKLRCIGATTPGEYRKSLAKDPAIERRFQTVKLEGLSPEDTHKLLRTLRRGFEEHHGVTIGRGTLSAAVILSDRYLPRRELPDKAIDVLDQACARFHLKMVLAETNPKALKATVDPRVAGKVTPHDVKKVVSAMSSLSLDDLNNKERALLDNLETLLNHRVVGQEQAIAQVAAPIKKSKVGMADPNRPDAALFFLGPTGVGKTQLAKELADLVFGSTDLLYTFDMSEFVEPHSVSRLIGSPPGYVGHEEDGLLYVYMLNTPYSILLFDEIEKAHPQVYDIFLPMLDEGRLKDAKGRDISFRNAIILFTSNIGADVLTRDENAETNLTRLKAQLREHFRPEFLNRIDAFVPFYPLRQEDVRTVLRLMIDDIRRRLEDRRIGIRMYDSAYRFLGDKGYDPEFGARELKRAVERYIADPISELLLQKRFQSGDMIDIKLDGDQLSYERGKSSSRMPQSAS